MGIYLFIYLFNSLKLVSLQQVHTDEIYAEPRSHHKPMLSHRAFQAKIEQNPKNNSSKYLN